MRVHKGVQKTSCTPSECLKVCSVYILCSGGSILLLYVTLVLLPGNKKQLRKMFFKSPKLFSGFIQEFLHLFRTGLHRQFCLIKRQKPFLLKTTLLMSDCFVVNAQNNFTILESYYTLYNIFDVTVMVLRTWVLFNGLLVMSHLESCRSNQNRT